jgi:hypothetical protein
MQPSFCHRVVLSVVLLLAAALACNMPGVGDQPAATEVPIVTLTVMAVNTPIVEATPLQVATTGATPPAEPTATTPGNESTAAGTVDPCSLITAAEAESLLGEAVGEPTPVEGGCIYLEPTERIHTVTVFAAQGEAAAEALGVQLFLVSLMGGMQLDEATVQESQALTEAGDVVGLVEQMTTLAAGQSAFHAEAVEGLGDAALWVWMAMAGEGAPQQGFLVAAQGETAAGINLVVGDGRDEAETLATARPLVERILNR